MNSGTLCMHFDQLTMDTRTDRHGDLVSSSFSIKSLPKFSVPVGDGDVSESHIVIIVLKELFLAAQFSKIMTPSP